jgi:hypothetical protein
MKMTELRIKTLIKFLALCDIVEEKDRLLCIEEIVRTIHCSRGHAYNYLEALRQRFGYV